MTEHRAHCNHSNSHSNGYSDDVNDESLENGFDEIEVKRKRKKASKMAPIDYDMISLIGQHLRENGFSKTLDCLIQESGCELEHPLAACFRRNIVQGQWSEAMSTLDELAPLLDDEHDVQKMRLLIQEEKFLEYLESGDRLLALQCLRHDLTSLPLYHPEKRIQDLSQYVMCQSKEDLLRTANWPGVNGGARERLMDQLQAFMPASVMLPPKRLSYLLRQSIQLQVEKCPFHYSEEDDVSSYSLLTDHICSRSHFPSETIHTLREHTDEVWFLQFSHDGSQLATGCKDGHIFLWNTKPSERPRKQHVLKAQSSGITSLHWSPNDSLLLSCGAEDCPEVIVYDTATWEEKCRISHSSEDSLTCCAWHYSGQKFYVGGLRGQFYECSIDTSSVTGSWEGIRLHAIATHPYNDLVYGADSHMRIKQYNFQDKTHSTLIKEDHPIMSFSLSKDARYALLNVASQGVHLWDLVDQCLIKRYQGVTQGFYTIHSCFGVNDSFIASGSEDHHVYIWNQRRETPVIVLHGHTKTVNCVTWNPLHPTMIASASDDCSVILWGTEEEMRRQRELNRSTSAVQQEESTCSVHVNGVTDRAEVESYEDEEDEEEEELDDEAEGLAARGSRPISESDLQALEMLEPESSSHDESISSTEQLDAAVSLSVLSVGISAVRERSHRQQQQQLDSSHIDSSSPGPILVIMPSTSSDYGDSSSVMDSSRREHQQQMVSTTGRVPVEIISLDRQPESELHSRSFDLDSSIESTGSRQPESLQSEEEITSTSMSVITSSVSQNIRTSDRNYIRQGGGGGEGEDVSNSSSNGSSTGQDGSTGHSLSQHDGNSRTTESSVI